MGSLYSGAAFPPPGQFSEISLHDRGGCGLRTDQAILCWGGSGLTLDPDQSYGIPVPEGSFTQVIGFGQYTCGLRTNQTVDCWFSRPIPQDGYFESVGTPPSGKFTSIHGSHTHTSDLGRRLLNICGLRTDMTIACWSDPPTSSHWERHIYTDIPTGPFRTIALGPLFGCGIRADQTLACWYTESYDEWRSQYTEAPTAAKFTDLVASRDQMCGLKTDHSIVCWGHDPGEPPTDQFSTIVANGGTFCAIRLDGTTACWRSGSDSDHLRLLHPPAGRFTQIAVTHRYACGLQPEGTIDCWAPAPHGNPPGRFAALRPDNLAPYSMCAIRTDKTIACWSDQQFGIDEPPPGHYTHVSVQTRFACAIRTDKRIVCWGDGNTPNVLPRPTWAPGGPYRHASGQPKSTDSTETYPTSDRWAGGFNDQPSRVDRHRPRAVTT